MNVIIQKSAVLQAIKSTKAKPKKNPPKKKLQQVVRGKVAEAKKLPEIPLPIVIINKPSVFLQFYTSRRLPSFSFNPLNDKSTVFDFKVDKKKSTWSVESAVFPSLCSSIAPQGKGGKKELVRILCQKILETEGEKEADILVSEYTEAVKPILEKIKTYRDLPVKINVDVNDGSIREVLVSMWARLGLAAKNAMDARPFASDEAAFVKWRPEVKIENFEDVEIPNHILASSVPIANRYAELIHTISSNSVTIVSAETGAGKSTQLPQFILRHYKHQGRKHLNMRRPNIIVTQPRRIAATSVATRVAHEMETAIGESVGYMVRFGTKKSDPEHPNGTIDYITSGVLLRIIKDDPTLQNYTHIFLDEVHEREAQGDLLFMLIRNLLQTHRPDLKIVLMSATADTALFQKYFSTVPLMIEQKRALQLSEDNVHTKDQMEFTAPSIPPIVTIKGKCFPVKENYICDILPQMLEKSSHIHAKVMKDRDVREHLFADSRGRESMIPLRLLEGIIAHKCIHTTSGSILVFLPGLNEIKDVEGLLLRDAFNVGFSDSAKFKFFRLHSSLEAPELNRVFDRVDPSVRKIILATNIAETSITITDVVYVVDSGRVKVSQFNAGEQTSSLKSVYASRSSLKQRIGRAGRVQAGEYYSIISRKHMETLPVNMRPDLLRMDIQPFLLNLETLETGFTCRELLANTPNPPETRDIDIAVRSLKSIGAMDRDEGLTKLGKIMAMLPLDPWMAKTLIYGILFKCLDPVITLAACLSIGRPVFAVSDLEQEQKAKVMVMLKEKFGGEGGDQSDHLVMINAYNDFSRNAHFQREYAARYHLNLQTMNLIARTRRQFYEILGESGLVPKGTWSTSQLGGPVLNRYAKNKKLLLGIVNSAVYPNIARVMDRNVYQDENVDDLLVDTKTFNRYRQETVLPPQYLCFSSKHEVERQLFMRETATINWFALATLSPCKFSVVGSGKHYIDGWIPLDTKIEEIKLVNSFKRVIEAYMEYCLRRNYGFETPGEGRDIEVLVNEFLAVYVKLVEKS